MAAFDLIVIGTGSAGNTVARACRSAGWNVAIVDERPFGGTCALRGCDPKKVLVGAAELIDWTRRMEGKGIAGDHVRLDWPALMRFKRTFTEPVPPAREKGLVDAGVATYHGPARFVGDTSLSVDGQTLDAHHIVVASGARPATLGVPGEELLTTSEQFLDLDGLPRRIVFIGGGYISFEFSHIAARTGADVRIIQRGPRPLPGFDPDLVDRLVAATRDAGIDVRLNAAFKTVERAGRGLKVHAAVDGRQESFDADLVVHGAGRVPDLDHLDVATARIETTKRGVRVNEYMQSVSNPAIYAAGDAADSGGLPLTPVAGLHGDVVAANVLEGNHRRPDHSLIPSVVFAIPHLAAVGLKEREARDKGIRFKVNSNSDTSGWYSSRRTGEKYSGYKVLIEEESGKLLGAHLLGSNADEVINVFAVAMRAGLRAKDVADLLYAYPTHGSDLTYMV